MIYSGNILQYLFQIVLKGSQKQWEALLFVSDLSSSRFGRCTELSSNTYIYKTHAYVGRNVSGLVIKNGQVQGAVGKSYYTFLYLIEDMKWVN